MILLSLIFLFILATLSTTFMFVGIHTADLSAIKFYFLKGVLGSIASASVGGIVYAIKSFFDTREAKEKHADKLALRQAKYNYKLDKQKLNKKI